MSLRKTNKGNYFELSGIKGSFLRNWNQFYSSHISIVINKVSNHTLSFSKDTHNEYY